MEGKNWKKEIDYFLFQYRTTPHSGTGMTPAKLLIGRELRGKIPSMPEKQPAFLKKAKANDAIYKGKMKKYHDTRFKAKSCDIKLGDTVLLRQKYQNKLSTRYDPKPYIVVRRQGTVLIIERDGRRIMRNSNLVKHVDVKQVHNDKRCYINDDDDDDDVLINGWSDQILPLGKPRLNNEGIIQEEDSDPFVPHSPPAPDVAADNQDENVFMERPQFPRRSERLKGERKAPPRLKDYHMTFP